jgi:hypothetical protein
MSTETMRPVRSRAEALYSFRVHLALYVALNIILLGFNVLTGAPWWSLWILSGWGVLVMAHGVAALFAESVPRGRLLLVGAAVLLTAGAAQPAYAHCDSMDGPVVKAAQKALETGNINHALIWVAPADEASIRTAFRRTLAVRKQSPSARELADLWFFETLVRVHRQAEGAPYTGLKPAGQGRHPAVEAADSALATRSLTVLNRLLAQAIQDGLRERFHSALARRNSNVNDLGRGRAYVQAYVSLIHYAEAVYDLSRRAGVHEYVTAAGK